MGIDSGNDVESSAKDKLKAIKRIPGVDNKAAQILVTASEQVGDVEAVTKTFDEVRSPYRSKLWEMIPGMASYEPSAALAYAAELRHTKPETAIGVYEKAKVLANDGVLAADLATVSIASGVPIERVCEFHKRLGMKETWGGKNIGNSEAVTTLVSMAVAGEMGETIRMFNAIRDKKVTKDDDVAAILTLSTWLDGNNVEKTVEDYKDIQTKLKGGLLSGFTDQSCAVLTLAAALGGNTDEVVTRYRGYIHGKDKIGQEFAVRMTLVDEAKSKGVAILPKDNTYSYMLGKVPVSYTYTSSMYLGKV